MRRLIPSPTALILLTACSTATIERVGAPNLEARIVGSDDKNVYVTSDDGQAFAVPRRTIRDIDHPGNVLLIIGGSFLFITGITYLASNPGGNSADRTVGNFYGMIGAPMFLGGLIPYVTSSRAAANFQAEPALPDASVAPLELPVLVTPEGP